MLEREGRGREECAVPVIIQEYIKFNLVSAFLLRGNKVEIKEQHFRVSLGSPLVNSEVVPFPEWTLIFSLLGEIPYFTAVEQVS